MANHHFDESKAVLEQSAYLEAERVFDAHREEFMSNESRKTNVVGFGIGVKSVNGQPTGKPSVVALVDQKVPKDYLSKEDRIPEKIGDMATDVVEVGVLQAAAQLAPSPSRYSSLANGYAVETAPSELYLREEGLRYDLAPRLEAPVAPQLLAKRVRPAKGGYSVGHYKVTAGTIATMVYDMLPGGIGIPSKFYILSNNHVLANSNDAKIGDPILQPGSFDGGTLPADVIARLSRFVPIQFAPTIPLAQQNNLVDAAVAEGAFDDLDRSIYWIGDLRGWTPKACIKPGLKVQKTGRTTNYTLGRVQVVKATVDVNYGGGRVARFKDQIVTTNMSAGGDSGSLITTTDNVAVGLLFAGSSVATICNYIEHVRSLLKVEVAEQMLLI